MKRRVRLFFNGLSYVLFWYCVQWKEECDWCLRSQKVLERRLEFNEKKSATVSIPLLSLGLSSKFNEKKSATALTKLFIRCFPRLTFNEKKSATFIIVSKDCVSSPPTVQWKEECDFNLLNAISVNSISVQWKEECDNISILVSIKVSNCSMKRRVRHLNRIILVTENTSVQWKEECDRMLWLPAHIMPILVQWKEECNQLVLQYRLAARSTVEFNEKNSATAL